MFTILTDARRWTKFWVHVPETRSYEKLISFKVDMRKAIRKGLGIELALIDVVHLQSKSKKYWIYSHITR